MAEAENVTISKELLSQLINIANPSMPGGPDIVNGALRAMRPAEREYLVLYAVRWQPEKEYTDGPMDRDHKLAFTDDRVIDHRMLEIGDPFVVGRMITHAQNAIGNAFDLNAPSASGADAMVLAWNIIQRARLIAGMDHVRLASAGLNLTELDYHIEDVATALARKGLVANEGLFEPSEEPTSTNP